MKINISLFAGVNPIFLIILVFCICIQSPVTAQNSGPVLSFTAKDGSLNIKCTQGCAWKDLSFTLTPGKTQLVNEFGMTSKGELKTQAKDPALSKFIFSVKKNKKGTITVKNIAGLHFKRTMFYDSKDGAAMRIKD